MLKPIDIQQKEFELKVRGYDREQVDDFLDAIMHDMAILYKDNTALTQEVENLQRNCERLQAQAGKAEQSFELAKYQCDELKKNAQKEAKEIVDKANAEAKEILYTVEEGKEKIKGFCQELLEKLK